jgi:prefoldin subunit 5
MGAVKERDYRKECTRLRKRVQMLEKKLRQFMMRTADLEDCGIELELEETIQWVEAFEEEIEESQPTPQEILQELKKKRMRAIEQHNDN